MSQLSFSEWQQFINQHPEAHLLQTGEWGELKAQFGWKPERVLEGEIGAQILFRRFLGGISLAYIPKGPVGIPDRSFWKAVFQVCRQNRALLLKVEPDQWEKDSPPPSTRWEGFSTGGYPVQPRQTVLVRLDGSPEQWLMRMKQKTRYNIRLAEKKGVVVDFTADIPKFHQQMLITGARDGFGVHSLDYYQRAYDLFSVRNECALLEARFEDESLAMLMVFARGKRAWYFYGASTDVERNRMPTYLLQWKAMLWAAERGCTEYDLWGIPDSGEENLEEQFSTREDGLWGVYRFKRGFGGEIARSAGVYERGLLPGILPLYRLYEKGSSHQRD